jgi:hypothetical protein
MSRPYTGPTGFRIQAEELHVEGYPDAERLVKLSTTIGKRLADMRLHQSDLEFCERVLQIMGNAIPTAEPSNDLSRALWICALTKFYSCFGNSGSRAELNPKKVYAGSPDALKAFHYYKHIRNKNVVHDENNYAYATTGVVLGSGGDVEDILSLQAQIMTDNRENGQNLYNLVDAARKYVSSQVNAILAKAFAEAHALSPEQRKALPAMQFSAPVPGDEAKRRTY